MPTAIWSSRLRSGSAHYDLGYEKEAAEDDAKKKGRRRRILLKSRNLYLASREIYTKLLKFKNLYYLFLYYIPMNYFFKTIF